MTTTAMKSPAGINRGIQSVWAWIRRIPPVYFLFLAVYIFLAFLNPNLFATTNGIMTFLRRSSPLAVLAIGEMMVLALGGFDLSIGSIVTLVVLASSLLLNNDPAKAYPAIGIMIGLGLLIGLANGLITSYLKVPSFIVTLGMMLLVRGGALYWVGGAPRGYLTDNWRAFGRNYFERIPLLGWEHIPLLGRVPYALVILLIIGAITYYLFHRTNFGRQILSIGDNVRASRLSGTRVELVRVVTFIICALCAILGGIMIGGYGGVNVTIGQGLEMQTIAACVVGGVMLLGGKGSVPNVIFGAFTMQAIVELLNLLGLPKPYKDAVQGLIIIAAVAYSAYSTRRKR